MGWRRGGRAGEGGPQGEEGQAGQEAELQDQEGLAAGDQDSHHAVQRGETGKSKAGSRDGGAKTKRPRKTDGPQNAGKGEGSDAKSRGQRRRTKRTQSFTAKPQPQKGGAVGGCQEVGKTKVGPDVAFARQ